ncbi:MAG: hypothetical protein J5J00_15630 [Deltaproteobacteria bacterium]|nr:hypothetical protein [Deltaproteobacteria bacterium]
MATKNRDGKFILAAGEIGSFAVCPEAWRLRTVEKVQGAKSSESELGETLHNEWASHHDEAYFFARGIRVVLFMIAASIVIGALMMMQQQ